MSKRRHKSYHSTGRVLTPWEAKLAADYVEQSRPAEKRAGAWQPHLAMTISIPACLGLGVFAIILSIWWWQELPVERGFKAAGSAGLGTFGVMIIISGLLAVIDFSPTFARLREKVKMMREPEPEPGPIPIKTSLTIIIPGESGDQEATLDLPVEEKVLTVFCQCALNRQPISYRAWAAWMTLGEFNSLRDIFMGKGFAAWKNPDAHQQGWEITEAGRPLIKRLAEGDYDVADLLAD